jgi:hypothetical protein
VRPQGSGAEPGFVVRRRPMAHRWLLGISAALCSVLGGISPAEVAAQQQPGSAEVAAQEAALGISPRGAFLRALAVPGWGHAAIGSYTRGGFYFGAQTATVYTLLRTRMRVGEAQDRVRLRESIVRGQAEAAGVTDPFEIQARFEEDPVLQELNGLLESRKDQQEDLVALGIFLLFLSGADAYVSAHLARFPEPLELQGRPTPDGGVEVGVRLSLPR